MTLANQNTKIRLDSNGVPDHTAWAMGPATAVIEAQNHVFKIPRVPVLKPENQAQNANMGALGYAVNGVAIYSPYNAHFDGCCDATFQELTTMDFCLGHPAAGMYHYHYFSHNTEGIDP